MAGGRWWSVGGRWHVAQLSGGCEKGWHKVSPPAGKGGGGDRAAAGGTVILTLCVLMYLPFTPVTKVNLKLGLPIQSKDNNLNSRGSPVLRWNGANTGRTIQSYSGYKKNG